MARLSFLPASIFLSPRSGRPSRRREGASAMVAALSPKGHDANRRSRKAPKYYYL